MAPYWSLLIGPDPNPVLQVTIQRVSSGLFGLRLVSPSNHPIANIASNIGFPIASVFLCFSHHVSQQALCSSVFPSRPCAQPSPSHFIFWARCSVFSRMACDSWETGFSIRLSKMT